MFVLSGRSALLLFCMAVAWFTGGRPPGAVNLRTREIEMSIAAERKVGREKPGAVTWPQLRAA